MRFWVRELPTQRLCRFQAGDGAGRLPELAEGSGRREEPNLPARGFWTKERGGAWEAFWKGLAQAQSDLASFKRVIFYPAWTNNVFLSGVCF